MSSQQLYDHLSTILADKSSNYFTDEERWTALNMACARINQETSFLRDTYTVTVKPTDEYVLLPEDFSSFANGADWTDANGKTTALEYEPYRKVRRQSGHWLDQPAGTPTKFTVDGPVIHLLPKPSQEGSFSLNYVPMPNILSEDIEPPFFGDPRFNGYHDLIVYMAAWDLLMKDRDFDMADRIQRVVKERMVDFQESLRRLPDKINTHWNIGDLYGV